MTDRIELFKNMLAADPDNAMVLFGLANEYQKKSDWPNVIATLEEYLSKADDEGAAYGMLARAYMQTGQTDKAKAALEKGISTALSHGHPTMAGEFRQALDEI
jgi:predicted Zn-dependent protease